MTERIVTFCDLCNVDQNMLWRGFFKGPTEEALKIGWLECDYGIQCPTCVSEDEESREQDEAAGTFHGASLEAAKAIAEIVQISQNPPKPPNKT